MLNLLSFRKLTTMKILNQIIFTLLLVAVPFLTQAQKQKKAVTTCEFTVEGVCEMCKERIEEAALIHGVKLAEWDKTSGKIKVIYREDRISEQEIHEAIARAGHDTNLVTADSAAYAKLPNCCSYKDGVHKH